MATTLDQMKCIWKEVKKVEELIKQQPSYTGGDKNFLFIQQDESEVWYINHNLQKYPSVTIFGIDGEEVEAQVTHISNNELKIEFNIGFIGWATLN